MKNPFKRKGEKSRPTPAPEPTVIRDEHRRMGLQNKFGIHVAPTDENIARYGKRKNALG